MKDLINLIGRQLVVNQKDSSIIANSNKIAAITDGFCNRCGSQVKYCLPSGKKYCRSCIRLGRICEDDILWRIPCQEKLFPCLKNGGLTWQGKLTPAQREISIKLVKNFTQRKNTLIHAVTGAGKTEMLFPLIAACLKQGKRACIAAPRIDVVNELYPRFQAAFNKLKIGKYHGREFKEIKNEQFILCTTHQLMKFYQAFDLLVIDEVDSFPYLNNSQLHFAAKNAVKEDGSQVFLTATPTKDLLSAVHAKKLCRLNLKRRFHGGLLPVPKEKLFLQPFLLKNRLNSALCRQIVQIIRQKHPLLIFVPRIEQIPQFLAALKKIPELAGVKMTGVFANDPDRIKKVAEFRFGKLDLLVTTTILERGVTFKHVWVIVIAADDDIYTTPSLVQIAGRVGRAKDDPDGLILYCYHKYTKQINEAVRQIKEMNR